MVGLTALGFALLAYELALTAPRMFATQGTIGVDFHQYQDHARRWLAGGGFYTPEQLAGPYDVFKLLPPLYPPTLLVLIVPFLVLPQILWWAIPLVIVTAVVAYWRPAPWAWPILGVLVAWPRTWEMILFGNPAIWVAAAVAAGTIWGWPTAWVLLKPTLLPFALIGFGRRSWWVGLLIVTVVSIPFAMLWIDYTSAVLNSGLGWTYSLREVPVMLIPVVAWASRTHPHVALARQRTARSRPGKGGQPAPPQPRGARQITPAGS